MKVTKIGHCCMLIEEKGMRILTDPGSYTTAQNDLEGIDLILITHEHGDHLHIESMQKVMAKNTQAHVICNAAVGRILGGLGIAHEVVDGVAQTTVNGLPIEACDGKHEEIFEAYGQVQNTGYLIADKLFFPGDAFKAPEKQVEILALPIAGPWCRFGDAMRYAIKVRPKVAFPVHDAIYAGGKGTMVYTLSTKILGERGMQFVTMESGSVEEF